MARSQRTICFFLAVLAFACIQRMLGLGSGTSVGDGLFRHRRAGQMIEGACAL